MSQFQEKVMQKIAAGSLGARAREHSQEMMERI